MGFLFIMNITQFVFFPKSYNEERQLIIIDSDPKLAIKCVRRGLAQWMVEDFIDCLEQFGGLKNSAFDLLREALQARIGLEPCARRATELTANRFLVFENNLHRLADKIMMVASSLKRWGFWRALRSFQNLVLGSANGRTIFTDPSKRVIVTGSTHIDKHAVSGGRVGGL